MRSAAVAMTLLATACLSGPAKLEPKALETVEPEPPGAEPESTVPIPEANRRPDTPRKPGECPVGTAGAEVGRGRVAAKFQACDGPEICHTDENGCEICKCREDIDRDAPEHQTPELDLD